MGAGRRAFVVAAASLASLALAASASATEHHPTGIFAPFADCPLSNSTVAVCTFAETTSGEFTIGKRTVPITKPVILQGGYTENEAGEVEFYAAEDGNTLTKVAEPVPGGLLNVVAPEFLPKFLQEALNKIISEGATGVTATTELAKPASSIVLHTQNLIFEEGLALQLPIKIKLDNPFLGSSCYIGSKSNPIILNLTTGATSPPGPNKSIHGSAGALTIESEGALVRLTGVSLVDNAFAAPGANGCGGFLLELLVDPAVNAGLGVPATAGNNTAILSGHLESAVATSVKESE